MIVKPNTLVEPNAVVVHAEVADPAGAAVVGARWLHLAALAARLLFVLRCLNGLCEGQVLGLEHSHHVHVLLTQFMLVLLNALFSDPIVVDLLLLQ